MKEMHISNALQVTMISMGYYFGGWPVIHCFMICLADVTDLCKNLVHILGELGYKNTKYWVINRIVQLILTFWLKVVLLSYLMFTKTMYSVNGFDSIEYAPK